MSFKGPRRLEVTSSTGVAGVEFNCVDFDSVAIHLVGTVGGTIIVRGGVFTGIRANNVTSNSHTFTTVPSTTARYVLFDTRGFDYIDLSATGTFSVDSGFVIVANTAKVTNF